MPLQQVTAARQLGLYIHVPFCRSKCAYCDFYSFRPSEEGLESRYTDAVISHMESYRDAAAGYAVTSVFVGGGTPTALPEDDLIRLLRAAGRIFHLSPSCEFTVEANPATVNLRLLRRMRRAGVNRLSFGLQTADDAELRGLSRIHTREQFEESYRLARKARFDNVNVDLMFGIPGQTMDSLGRTLRYVTGLRPEHISLYNLRVEPRTVFGRLQAEGKLRLPDDEVQADMYLNAVAFLERVGYRQYEISNFSRRGYQCRHNLKYWNCEEYLGFGPGAHSYFADNRFSFLPDLKLYMSGTLPMNAAAEITGECETILPQQRIGEYVMLRLRLREGISSEEFGRRFGRDFEEMYGRKLEKYVPGGYVAVRRGHYALTPRGMLVSNYILSDILEFGDLRAAGYNGIH